LVHYAVLKNHIHFLVEGKDRAASEVVAGVAGIADREIWHAVTIDVSEPRDGGPETAVSESGADQFVKEPAD
jgi:hypothetical protein